MTETQIESSLLRKTTSREVLDGEQMIRLLFVKNPQTWFTKEQVLTYLLEENGKKMSIGRFRNIITKLRRLDFLETRRSTFAEYRLKSLKSEVDSMAMGSRLSRDAIRWRLDFFDYLETLSWEDVCRVHDVRLWSRVESLSFVVGDWEHKPRRCLYQRAVDVDGVRVQLQARYGQGKSLTVIVACGDNPASVGIEGLTWLYGLVSKTRASYCNCEGVPDVGEWTVVQWHFGRDTKGSIEGADFALSFKDWFGNLVRVYSRHDDKVRAERVENPNVKFAALLGIDREPTPLTRDHARMYDR